MLIWIGYLIGICLLAFGMPTVGFLIFTDMTLSQAILFGILSGALCLTTLDVIGTGLTIFKRKSKKRQNFSIRNPK